MSDDTLEWVKAQVLQKVAEAESKGFVPADLAVCLLLLQVQGQLDTLTHGEKPRKNLHNPKTAM